MACSSCKNKKDLSGIESVNLKEEPIGIRFLTMLLKIFMFLVASVMVSVVVVPYSIYMLFKIIILNEGVDVNSFLHFVSKKIIRDKDDDDDDDDDDFEMLDDDEYVLYDVDNVN
jgi:hypothetical protein